MEWCDGEFDSTYYARDTAMNKVYDIKDIRMFKGGSWASFARHCRISNSNYDSREMRNYTIGLRLAETVTKQLKSKTDVPMVYNWQQLK